MAALEENEERKNGNHALIMGHKLRFDGGHGGRSGVNRGHGSHRGGKA